MKLLIPSIMLRKMSTLSILNIFRNKSLPCCLHRIYLAQTWYYILFYLRNFPGSEKECQLKVWCMLHHIHVCFENAIHTSSRREIKASIKITLPSRYNIRQKNIACREAERSQLIPKRVIQPFISITISAR